MRRLLLVVVLLAGSAVLWRATRAPRAPAWLGPGEVSLLHKRPDDVVGTTGKLIADPRRAWGAAGPFGWEASGVAAKGDRPAHVWSRGRVAHLSLAAGAARDREVRLLAWVADDARPAELTVRLNGVVLRRGELGATPTKLTFHAPAESWRESRFNVLELEVDPRGRSGTGRAIGLALAQVDYDTPAQAEVDPDRGHVVLAPGTSVAYRAEEVGPLELLLRGQASRAGTLTIRSTRWDPERGELAEELDTLSLELADRAVERGLRLPETAGILETRLSWESDDPRSSLELTTLVRREASPTARPPVVFLSIDTLAAKHLNLYGYGRDTAPHLTRFAQDAVLFEHCVANAPWTVPSYMSVLTGLYADAHQLDTAGFEWSEAEVWEKWHLAENRWTLAETLRAAGYATGGFVDGLWLTPRFGFAQGFDAYDASASTLDKTNPDGGIRQVRALAEDWLEELPPGAPFFLFLHAFDVHGPYSPPPPFRGRFRDGTGNAHTAPGGGMVNTFGSVASYISEYAGANGAEPIATTPLIAAYDEGVAMVDDEVGGFLDELRERGIYDEALIVISADHGETMADDALLFGHGVLDELVLHVPLLIKLPGSDGGGRRVPDTVQLVDLVPTVRELVGLPARAHLHGRSLAPLLAGDPLPPAVAFAEGGLMDQRALYAEGWKLVETVPAVGSAPQTLLSLPWLPEEWTDRLAPAAADVLSPEELARLAYLDLPGELFPAIARTGVTPELWERFAKDPAAAAAEKVLRQGLRSPRQTLFELAADPYARNDRAGVASARAATLRELMAREEARCDRARAFARPPTQAVHLSAEDVEELARIGYAEGSDVDDE